MASQHKIIDLMNKGEITMRSCGQKKDDLVTLLRGECAKEVALFQSQGVNVRSRFQAVHVDDYVDAEGVDGLAGLEVKEIMTPDAGLQRVVLVPKDKKRTWDVDLFANQGAFPQVGKHPSSTF